MLYDSIYVQFWKRQYDRDRKQIRARLRQKADPCPPETESQEGINYKGEWGTFGGDGYFYIFTVVMVAQLYTIAQTHQIIHLKRVNFTAL